MLNNQRFCPSTWKSAVVTQILKPGEQTTVGNYRPISILPVVSKVAKEWIAKQPPAQLYKINTPLHPMQFRLYTNYSTETAKSKLDEGVKIGAVFLTLKKAFDTVNHEVLPPKWSFFNFSIDAIK